jgi:hypothetical protein
VGSNPATPTIFTNKLIHLVDTETRCFYESAGWVHGGFKNSTTPVEAEEHLMAPNFQPRFESLASCQDGDLLRVSYKSETRWAIIGHRQSRLSSKANLHLTKSLIDAHFLIPSERHFSISGSTYARAQYAVDPSQITDAVTMINYTEFVMFKLGGGAWTRAAGLDRFTVTWLEQVGGNWRRKPQKNAIRQGSIEGLDRDDAIPPNMHF